jgi:hypothetical protein
LVVRTHGGSTTLGLDAGGAFHSTPNEVLDQRLIDVPGTSIRLVTWTEVLPDTQAVPFYAVSLDGQSVATVRRTSYALKLRHGDFDPGAAVPPVMPSLAADATTNLFIVQFGTQPLEEFRTAIADLGGTVRHFLANHSHIVQMTPQVRDAVAALPYVRWVGPYHPAYRLEEFMRDNQAQAAELFPLLRYNIQVFEAGLGQKTAVAQRIEALGGAVDRVDAGKFLLEATLTPEQLFEVVRWDEVLFVDRWSAYEMDMNNARELGGANHIETVGGYAGAGVRGEVFDGGFNVSHVDFASRPLIQHPSVGGGSHGAATSGICFGDGTGNPNARGLLPEGQGIVADYNVVSMTGPNRYTHTGELVQAPYFAVFQTASVGSSQTSQYTTISADTDAALFDFDIVHCQSQSNLGSQASRPQAWAKNIISGGGVRHYDTLTMADDCWCGGASIGPATDGRIKPDLCAFYDDILTTTSGSPTAYTNSFGGTSGATPIICGHVGLFFQMWADGIFSNELPVPGGTVFENRAHMTTAKAVMINTAQQYPFTGTGHDLTRIHQGWGWPDLGYLYDMRENMYVIDETDLLTNMESMEYFAFVAPGEPALRVTLVYADPPGLPSSSQHRINDLTLKVSSPSNVIYWGNNGLLESNWSTPGGSENVVDTVENVFVQEPETGVWSILVIASEINEDSHVETPDLDADFALVVTGAPPGPRPPRAVDSDVSTAVSTASTFTLEASDDGLPDPPAALSYIVTSLPSQGDLSDPGAGAITSVPYALAAGGNQVEYQPVLEYQGTDNLEFKANDGGVFPEGGDSNTAMINITVGGPDWDPVAASSSASTARGIPTDVALVASDPNGDPLTYYVESLPASGTLSDPGAGAIDTVPYELVDGGNVVTYQPPCCDAFTDTFNFSVRDLTAASNVAGATVTMGGPAWDPVAHDVEWSTPIDTPTDVPLAATDPNADPLTYYIESLPNAGTLLDPGAGEIHTVPYELVGGGNVVTYDPPTGQNLEAVFGFSVQDATAGSNVATATVTVGGPSVVHFFGLEADAGWSTEGDWAFGEPTGDGGAFGGPDPTDGHTGNNVYGYNLGGDYGDNMPVYYLTTTALDCSTSTNVELRFWKWLGVEGYFDDASVQVSNDGTSWTTIWEHAGATVSDNSWSEMIFDISDVADNEPTVYVRWGMGPTDGSNTYCGWNVDDMEIIALVAEGETCDDGIHNQGEDLIDCGGPCPPCECLSNGECDDTQFCTGVETCDAYGDCQGGTDPCGAGEWCDEANDGCVAFGDGDFDFDGDIDMFDYSWFQACFGQIAVGDCEPGNMTGSGTIELDDFSLFVAGLGGPL